MYNVVNFAPGKGYLHVQVSISGQSANGANGIMTFV